MPPTPVHISTLPIVVGHVTRLSMPQGGRQGTRKGRRHSRSYLIGGGAPCLAPRLPTLWALASPVLLFQHALAATSDMATSWCSAPT